MKYHPLNLHFFLLLIPRIGIVFIGSSEETLEVKILGKLERYFFSVF